MTAIDIQPEPAVEQASALDPGTLETLNGVFEKQHPQQIVNWAAHEFGDELVMSSSFGAESALLIHMATRAKPDIKIVMVDTGYLFPETHGFMEQLRRRFDLNVWVYRTKNDPIAYLAQHGEGDPTWRKDVDACCAVNKNEPMERAMRELRPAPGCAASGATRPSPDVRHSSSNGRRGTTATRSRRC